MVAFIRSCIFALIFYSGTVVYVLAAFAAALVSPNALRAVARGWSRFHRICCRYILGQRVKVEGDLPDQPLLFVFKHESMFETIDLLCFFRAPMVAAKQELVDIPGWGWAAKRFGIMAVQREAGATAMRSMRRIGIAALAEGRPICLFPEGTRVPHGETPPVLSGFAGLYKLLNVAVVPVAVDSGKVAPRNHFVKQSGTITYRVGETIPPGLPRQEAEARVHKAINSLNRLDDSPQSR